MILAISILIIVSPQFKQRFIIQTYTEMKDFNFGINREFEQENLREKTIFNKMYIFSGYHNNLLLTSLNFTNPINYLALVQGDLKIYVKI